MAAGGNRKQVAGDGFTGSNCTTCGILTLSSDSGGDPAKTAAHCIAAISDDQRRLWASGTAVDRAMESFALARGHSACGANRWRVCAFASPPSEMML